MKMFHYFILIGIVCWTLSASAQTITEERDTTWHHFDKVVFKINGTSAWYVKPQKALPGNPWVWRAHFPTWHTQMDSILVERGFHIAYINTNNLFGHPKAMAVWDDFYNYLVTKKDFAPKVALEGVSRGGLYVYGWAKRNPGKVSCIYAEAPVCDFKSWPGGKGIGKGSGSEWQRLLNVYGFTEDEALNYTDLPVNDLETLAAFKVPVLHVVSLNDKIVPVAENTFPLINNYIKLGGPATVIPMTKGKQELEGHHFQIENPERLADFIYKSSVPVVKSISSDEFIQPYGNLKNAFYRIEKERKVKIAFLGGSITNMNGWRNKISQYLKERYPQTEFTFINAGIPSLGSVPHAFRFQTDVLDQGRIDLLFIESAVNDKGNGTTETQQRRALEGIVRHAYSANPNVNIVMMAFADELKTADYNAGLVPLEVKVHQEIARYYKLPFINLAQEVANRIKAGEFTWEDDFKNLHPSPFGQEIYYQTIKALLSASIVDLSEHLTARKLPAALEKLNYSKGHYISVDQAFNKKGFIVDSLWKPADRARTRSGFVNIPVLASEKAGASFELSFTGSTIGIAVLAGPDAGKLHYTIDGKSQPAVDLYTKWSGSLHLPWYVVLGDDLSKGKHTLKAWIAKESNEHSKGNACRIAYFFANK